MHCCGARFGVVQVSPARHFQTTLDGSDQAAFPLETYRPFQVFRGVEAGRCETYSPHGQGTMIHVVDLITRAMSIGLRNRVALKAEQPVGR